MSNPQSRVCGFKTQLHFYTNLPLLGQNFITLTYTEVVTKKNSQRIGGLHVSSPLLPVAPGETRKSPLQVGQC